MNMGGRSEPSIPRAGVTGKISNSGDQISQYYIVVLDFFPIIVQVNPTIPISFSFFIYSDYDLIIP